MELDSSELILPDEVDGKPYIFVSYARRDMARVQEILQVLRSNGFRFWYDRGLKSGMEWAEELGEKIDHCEQFMVLLTENSVNSKYVRKEVGMATSGDKNMLVVYMKETQLTSGLKLLLGDIQALHRAMYRQETDFERALCEAASNNTLKTTEKTLSSFALEDTYEIKQKIGAGGLAEVYLARHKRTNCLVAVKYGSLENTYAGDITKERFESEKRILEMLSQKLTPYVPVLLDWYEDDDQIFLIESLIDGKPLSVRTEAPRSEEEVVTIARKVLKILQYLHHSNIVYMDVKPSNLFVNEVGDIYLIDFNISKILNDPYALDAKMGTLRFAAPEVYARSATSVHVGFPTDIYSLGRTMECLLCPEKFNQMDASAPVRYYRKDISAELEVIIEKMTATNPSDRYQTVEDVLEALSSINHVGIFQRLRNIFRSRHASKTFDVSYTKRMEQRQLDIREIAKDHTAIIDRDGNAINLADAEDTYV